jgi:hypothetical protein
MKKNKKMTVRKISIAVMITAMLFTAYSTVNAQTPPAVLQTLQSIYHNYDSVKYLSFDVKFDYGSDTLLGKFDSEQMDGTYTLAGNKAKYRLGDIDFMQNDSFFIAVYNKDKLIMVDEPKAINMGSQLPMRQQIDSLLLAYDNHYNISSYNLSADIGVIQLLGTDSLAQFERFAMQYDNRNYMLYQVSYEYKEPAELDSAVLAAYRASTQTTDVPLQKKRFTIRFLNYRYDNFNEATYDENNYIWFENGICKPSARYEDYKIYYTKPANRFYELQQQ